MLIQPMQCGNRMTLTERVSLRRALPAAVSVVLVFATSTAIAAEQGADVLDRADIGAGYSEIDGMIAELQGALASAETTLNDVKTMKREDSERMLNEFFKQMKDKVDLMLERLGPNSVLMDNIEGAKSNVIVFKRWLERQPSDYPNRDQLIVRLEQYLKDYDDLADQIVEGRRQAREALTMLARAEFYTSIELMVDSVELSVEMTKRVLVSLQGLGVGIRKAAEQTAPSSIPE
jgi:hypothetical protein